MEKMMRKIVFTGVAIFMAVPLLGLGGSFSRVSCNVASLPPERQFVAELLSSRVEARTPPSDCAQTLHVCFVLDASIPGENAAIMVKGNDATICAGRFVGLVQGAGALLRRIRYGRSTFTLDDGAYAFAPKKELRMAYFARHFHNWYHYATAEELTSYIDDLVLAGHNAFNFQYAYPTADRAGDTEEEKRRFADVSEKALARVHALDCGFCASGGSNQAPLDSPEELRGVPNSDRKRGNLGFNVCPAKPGGMDYLCDYRRRQLKELDGGRMDYPGRGFIKNNSTGEYALSCMDAESLQQMADDLKRNEMYKANAERAKQQASFADYGEYLLSLEMKAEIKPFAPIYMSRIAQLTNKSNQFNLTTLRCAQTDIERVAGDSNCITLYGKLEDKFGDNGVVSVVFGHIDEKDTAIFHVDLWLMSCRVLKRYMEQAMMDSLMAECKARGIKTVKGYYYPTAKNKMVKEFFAQFGFEKTSEDESGNAVWERTVEDYQNLNRYIKVNE